jgi:hypothetical protein
MYTYIYMDVPCKTTIIEKNYLFMPAGLNVDLLARSVCVPSAAQYDYSSLTYAGWVTAARRNGRALTLAGMCIYIYIYIYIYICIYIYVYMLTLAGVCLHVCMCV